MLESLDLIGGGESLLIKPPKTKIDCSIRIPFKKGEETPGVEVFEHSALYRNIPRSAKSTIDESQEKKSTTGSLTSIPDSVNTIDSIDSEVYYLAEGESLSIPKADISPKSGSTEEKQLKDNQFQEMIALLDEDLSHWNVEKESKFDLSDS